MGFWRVVWTGCLGMCCLIPLSWISFRFFDLGSAITNGLFTNLGPALEKLFMSFAGQMGAAAGVINILVQGLLGLIALLFFPLHWALYYRPDDIGMAIAIILPWILVGTITSALFCKSAKQGFDTGMAVGIGYAIGLGIIPFIINGIIQSATGGIIDFITIIDGLFTGLTDLPYLAAVLTACLEGGVIAGVFGAFIGSLKYNPETFESGGKKKKKKKMEEPSLGGSGGVYTGEPTTGPATYKTPGQRVCPNCGTVLAPGDAFCPNCGTKV